MIGQYRALCGGVCPIFCVLLRVNYCDANEDWEYAGPFADRGISGTSVKRREQFLKMMEACENGRIDLILTKSISSFARNTIDSVRMLRRLRDLNVEVYFQKENIWTNRSEGETATPDSIPAHFKGIGRDNKA